MALEVATSPYNEILSDDRIRLLRIHPKTDMSPHCSLESHSLSNCPSYVAISYRWRIEDLRREIVINDQTISVRENVWHIINDFSPASSSVHIWLDSVCINQDSLTEKNHQVKLMGRIYREATSVAIWLGNNSYTVETRQAVSDGPIEAEQRSEGDLAMNLLQIKFPEVMPPVSVDTTRSFLKKQDYFHRIWIVQEIILAKQVHMYWGRRCCSWDAIDFVIREEKRLHELALASSRGPKNIGLITITAGSPINKLCNWRMLISRGLLPDASSTTILIGIVRSFLDSSCTDVRDHVYGFLGILEDQVLDPDYSKSPFELYLDVVDQFAIMMTGSVDSFGAVLRDRLGLNSSFHLDSLRMLEARPVRHRAAAFFLGGITDLVDTTKLTRSEDPGVLNQEQGDFDEDQSEYDLGFNVNIDPMHCEISICWRSKDGEYSKDIRPPSRLSGLNEWWKTPTSAYITAGGYNFTAEHIAGFDFGAVQPGDQLFKVPAWNDCLIGIIVRREGDGTRLLVSCRLSTTQRLTFPSTEVKLPTFEKPYDLACDSIAIVALFPSLKVRDPRPPSYSQPHIGPYKRHKAPGGAGFLTEEQVNDAQ